MPAASNIQSYALLFVTADGPLLAQEQHVTVTRSTNSQPVRTVALGYAGESPGAAMLEFDVTSAVPAAGQEFDAGNKMLTLTPTQLFLVGPAGKELKGVVMIYSDVLAHGVDKQVEYSFKARGAFQVME
jgi:hypothetical protein